MSTVCPACGNHISEDTMLWTYQMKFYCSEACVRTRLTRPQPPVL